MEKAILVHTMSLPSSVTLDIVQCCSGNWASMEFKGYFDYISPPRFKKQMQSLINTIQYEVSRNFDKP